MNKDALEELKQNPIFQILIGKIKEDLNLPRFNPSSGKSAEEQADRWKFDSGRKFENDRILTLLGIKE